MLQSSLMRLSAFLLLAFINLNLLAQNITVTGTVTDGSDGEPVIGAVSLIHI